ncbi:MAG: heme o synthase [Verrucomicrobiae bacterium]|nr:heme o synthase [Verrucomicrobiae bacterium]MCP5540128.1 protoheme IX farnesyltransferase [Akkermansiaceae bacterium]
MAETIDKPEATAATATAAAGGRLAHFQRDLMALTKFRLSILVLVTALCGYFAAVKSPDAAGFDWTRLIDLGVGTLLAAFGSAVFNQLMEVDADARMRRTAGRPLPARRIPAGMAFAFGWVLSAFGVIHLGMRVNATAAFVAGATLLSYLFVYTPMKRRTGLNTLAGAVAGALPPLIGWAGGGGGLLTWGAAFLFLLLFLWQLPHFVAINWMYREEYERGGFVMWSNGDVSGARTARLALGFSLLVALLPVLPVVTGVARAWFLPAGAAVGGVMAWLAWKFFKTRRRTDARGLFFCTLLYLPVILVLALMAWR